MTVSLENTKTGHRPESLGLPESFTFSVISKWLAKNLGRCNFTNVVSVTVEFTSEVLDISKWQGFEQVVL